MRRFVMAISVVGLVLTGFVGTASAKVYKLTLQNMFSMNHPVSYGLEKMAKDLKAMTEGQIEIQAVPPGALVKAPESGVTYMISTFSRIPFFLK